jgi:plastocyanin
MPASDISVIQLPFGIEWKAMSEDRRAAVGRTSKVQGRHSLASRIVLVILIGMALSLAACSSGGGSSSSPAATSAAPSGGGGSSDAITIHNFAFSPATITVAPGATVTVTNRDQVTHTLTATKGAFGTGDITGGQSKTFTAPKTPGTYSYFCMIHQYMTGNLVVSG